MAHNHAHRCVQQHNAFEIEDFLCVCGVLHDVLLRSSCIIAPRGWCWKLCRNDMLILASDEIALYLSQGLVCHVCQNYWIGRYPLKKKITIYVGILCRWFLLMHTCGMTVSSVQVKDSAPSVFVFGTHTRLKAFFLNFPCCLCSVIQHAQTLE